MTGRLRVLVVDDEPLARSGLADLVARDPELTTVGQCGDGWSAVEAIDELQPDLVLLDVQMPEMDGFEVLRAVGPERMPPVVFVTAYDRFAVRAFEVHALDYILKPFDDERFAEAMQRAKRAIGQASAGAANERLVGLIREIVGRRPNGQDASPDRGPAPPYLTRLAVKRAGSVSFVSTEEIDWIEAASYYAKLHVNDRVHLLRETMHALEARLDPARFFRVSRSAIVNLDRVEQLQPYSRGAMMAVLRDGTKVKLSKARVPELEAILGQSL